MDSKQRTPSVIAKLMGLDELPPQQPVHKQPVLSENYLSKMASIRFLQERSYFHRSFRENIKKWKLSKEVFGVPKKLNIDKHHEVRENSTTTEAELAFTTWKLQHSKPSSVSLFGNNEICRKSGSPTMRGIALRSLKKLENGNFTDSSRELGVDFSHNLLKTRLELKYGSLSPRKIVVLKPKFGTAQKAPKSSFSLSSHKGSLLGYPKHKDFINPKIGELDNELGERKNSCNLMEPSKHSFRFSREFAKEISREIRHREKGSTLGEMLALPDQETRPRNLNYELDKQGRSGEFNLNNGDEDLGSHFGISSRDGWKDESGRNLPKSILSQPDSAKQSDSRFSSEKSDSFSCLDSEKNNTVKDMHLVLNDTDLEYNHTVQETQVIQIQHSETSPHILEGSIRQESSVKSAEEALVHSNCHKVDFEFPMSVGEGYSPSPNSVLEPPFTEEVSGSECFNTVSSDLDGLHMQLQFLQTESEEAYSEGSEMVVSSDGEESFDLSKERGNLIGLLRAEESRDFSYLVDVLDEAGFHSGNSEMGSFETWHSPEFPICPSVFETLEKKFGEQMCWERSERRLLFDCINVGLMEIFEPCLDVQIREKPLRRRLNTSWTREMIEDELWIFLVSHEKEVRKDLSEKVLGEEFRWVKFIDEICREIERFLFDELVAELVSIESF